MFVAWFTLNVGKIKLKNASQQTFQGLDSQNFHVTVRQKQFSISSLDSKFSIVTMENTSEWIIDNCLTIRDLNSSLHFLAFFLFVYFLGKLVIGLARCTIDIVGAFWGWFIAAVVIFFIFFPDDGIKLASDVLLKNMENTSEWIIENFLTIRDPKSCLTFLAFFLFLYIFGKLIIGCARCTIDSIGAYWGWLVAAVLVFFISFNDEGIKFAEDVLLQIQEAFEK